MGKVGCTKVLKGHIAVATTNINKYKNGKQIDVRARQFLKKDGLDYAHGTGHGVGFFSNVHDATSSSYCDHHLLHSIDLCCMLFKMLIQLLRLIV